MPVLEQGKSWPTERLWGMETPATFGRRGQRATRTASPRLVPKAPARLELDLTPEQRALILGPAASAAESERANLAGKVGWSRRGAFLALTIVSVLHTAVSIGVLQHQGAAGSPLLKAMDASGALSDAMAGAALPLSILAHLVAGAFTGGTSLWLAHHLLRRLDQHGILAYALGGAGMAGVWTLVSGSLFGTMLPAHIGLTIATGGVAAGLYRLFAGRTV